MNGPARPVVLPPNWRGRDGLLALALFLLCGLAYLQPRMAALADSHYTSLVSEALWERGSFDLDPFFQRPLSPSLYAGEFNPETGLPYQVYGRGERVYHVSGNATAVLSAPAVALLRAGGLVAHDGAGRYDTRAEMRIQRIVASWVTAATVMLLFALSRYLLPAPAALLLALGAGFGTSLWTTCSRVLWTHTWGMALLALGVLLATRASVVRRAPPAWLMGTVLPWLYFVRPILGVPALALWVYVAWIDRKAAGRTALVAALWLLAQFALVYHMNGSLVSRYHHMIAGDMHGSFLTGLAGLLISPGRGMFVYAPVSLVPFYLLLRHGRRIAARPLLWTALLTLALQVGLIASSRIWHAGHCYGSRYTTDVIPWLVLLTALGWAAARPAAPAPVGRALRFAVVALLLSASVWIQFRGCFRAAPWLWNARPNDIVSHPERLWDWSYPQFLAGLVPPPAP